MADTKRELFEDRLLRYQSNLESFVRSLMPFASIEDVRDVVQETNLAIIRHAEEYDTEKPFLAWCFAFARLQVMKAGLEARRSRLIFDDDLAAKIAEVTLARPASDSELAGSARLAALRICRSKLPPKHRDLLDARYERERSVNQIARNTGSNPHTVTTTLAYIRSRLRECMERLCRLSPDVDIPEPTSHRDTVNRLIDSPRDAADAFPELAAAFRGPEADELLSYYIEQRQMDDLLSLGRPPRVRRKPIVRWLAAAAGLVVLLGGLAYAAQKIASRPAAEVPAESPVTVPVPVRTVVPAAPTNTPVAAVPAAVSEGEKEMVKTQAVAVVAAAMAVSAPVVNSTAEAASVQAGDSSVAALSTAAEEGVSAVGSSDWSFVDTRSRAIGYSEGRDTWTISTLKPHGTVYSFQ